MEEEGSVSNLSVLDLFVLLCAERGIRSGYALRRQAGLSLGATTPALRRLAQAGLVSRTTSTGLGQRKRYEFSLTSSGRAALRRGWQEYLCGAAPPWDIDSVLRVLELAAHHGAHRKNMLDFVDRVAKHREQQAARHTLPSEEEHTELPTYTSLRPRFDLARAKADIAVLREIKELLAKNHGRSARRAKKTSS
jgi:DNA-binding MarR family transcriptional regulator